ncbi:hypothetical protein DPMN_040388 [Dreissena polymorpha]|uniref:Uncharacterized protein n=1 Tax=Dreissena polymorpha TaxID=45954 RepID=A0A9D4CWL7_DREPO|nr:hypothetical protein DPMN_040388 [Dreissena polymorpha]
MTSRSSPSRLPIHDRSRRSSSYPPNTPKIRLRSPNLSGRYPSWTRPTCNIRPIASHIAVGVAPEKTGAA